MTMHFYVMKLDGLFRWALCSQLLCNKWIVWTLMRAYCFFPKQRLKAVYLPLPFSIMLGHTVYSIIFPVLFVLLASSSELHQPSVTISTFLQGRRITTTVPHLLSRLPLFLIHRMVQAGKPTALPPSPAFPSIFFPLCALQLLIAPNTANFPLSSSISSKCSYISQTSVHHDEACLGL